MVLTTEEAELFVKLHSSLMGYLNQRLQIVSGVSTDIDFLMLRPEDRYPLCSALPEHLELIDDFVVANPSELSDVEEDSRHVEDSSIRSRLDVAEPYG